MPAPLSKIIQTLFIGALSVLLIFGLSLLALAAVNRGKVILGLEIGQAELGRMNKNRAEQFLNNEAKRFEGQKISLVYGDKSWSLTPRDLGISIDKENTLTAIMAPGRGQIIRALKDQIQGLVKGKKLSPVISVDAAKMEKALILLDSIETPAQNASLIYESGEDGFIVSPAASGQIADRSKIVSDTAALFAMPPRPVYLLLTADKPSVAENDILQIMPQARALADSAPYFLQNDNTGWQINKTELAGWISVAYASGRAELSLDTKKIKEFLIPLAPSINREPIDAKLAWENGNLKFTALSQNGQKLNIEASADKIARDIIEGKKNIYLITDSILPEISNQNTYELGLLTLLGRGESDFSGSPANRRHNIQTGTVKLNGILIKPGEEFIFGDNAGEIDAQNGWLPELVIKNGKTIPEFGGGLCQVSTTVFRAAVNAGLKITERHPHAYPVRYYDPPGFDATVYPPNPDLKFINNTPGHILLQGKIDGNKLIFEIYGTDDGREIKIIGPFTTQKNPDGSLKAVLTQEIWRNGQLAESKVFYSSYRSPALYPVINPATSSTPTPSPAIAPAPTN